MNSSFNTDVSPRALPLPEWTVDGSRPDSMWANLRELWQYRHLIVELTRRELYVRYKNRVGGVLWSLFPPILQAFTLALMVKLFLAPVNNYSAYLMAVMFLWQFFQNTVLDSGNSILVNQTLVRRTYFPRAIMPIVAVLTNMLHLGVALTVTLLYFFVIPVGHAIYPKNLQWSVLLVGPVILGVAILGLGLGFLTARFNTLYEDCRFLAVTFFGLFFYALPVLYPIEKVAARPEIYKYYMLNPMAAYLVAFQRALLPPLQIDDATASFPPVTIPWEFLLIAFGISLFICGLGFYVFERSKWTMMERM